MGGAVLILSKSTKGRGQYNGAASIFERQISCAEPTCSEVYDVTCGRPRCWRAATFVRYMPNAWRVCKCGALYLGQVHHVNYQCILSQGGMLFV